MKIGFIGTGNMGKAIIEGFISSKNVKSEDIFVFDIDSKKLEILADEFKVNTTTDENEAVKSSDLIILAVKPNIYDIILEKIKNSIDNNKIILTIAAGFSIERAEKIIGSNKKIIRTMPNTPAQVLEGMTGIVFNKNITNEEKDTVIKLLSSFGGVEEIDEKPAVNYPITVFRFGNMPLKAPSKTAKKMGKNSVIPLLDDEFGSFEDEFNASSFADEDEEDFDDEEDDFDDDFFEEDDTDEV